MRVCSYRDIEDIYGTVLPNAVVHRGYGFSFFHRPYTTAYMKTIVSHGKGRRSHVGFKDPSLEQKRFRDPDSHTWLLLRDTTKGRCRNLETFWSF